jgi:ankyrin repeat protein
VKLLLDAGADVHALNKWRETPLLTAANHGQSGAVESLLAAGADPCKCTDTGWSPLSIAAYKGHDECVRLLLEDGAPTEEDDPTLSALLQAATKGLASTVSLLLKHGADHTVTTKKGDTALSILVEQNLIDTAVEMVTEYNASMPRCSRDRKKVQRARLLINLRMKQMEREGKGGNGSSDDGDDSEEDDDAEINAAQHEPSNGDETPGKARNKKNGASKTSAEEKAKAAEEALLLELAKEETQAKKEVAKAIRKKERNKSKKEKERQQRQKEEKERQEKEEKEEQERERSKKEKDEQLRKDREKREKEEQVKEMMEREKAMAAKRKEREHREKLEKKQQTQKHRGTGSVSPAESKSSTASNKNGKQQTAKRVATDPTSDRKIVSPKAGAAKPVVPLAGNRRWETTAGGAPQHTQAVSKKQMPVLSQNLQRFNSSTEATAVPSTILPPRVSRVSTIETASSLSFDKNSPSSTVEAAPTNGVRSSQHGSFSGNNLEHPAITLFRRERLFELLQQCGQVANLISENTMKRVLYRWIVRAAHGSTPYTDPFIPSWDNMEQLVTYFQRQFISESRRASAGSLSHTPSMESLKEAGSWIATLCQSCSKQIVEYREHINEQLPPDWNDTVLGMTASEGALHGSVATVTVCWLNRAQTVLPALTLTTLRDRYVGSPDRFLATTLVTMLWHETMRILIVDTCMDSRLSPTTLSVLVKEVGVSAEFWSDPFSARSSNVFWGRFDQVDSLFGGQNPFARDECGSEEVLSRHGGSVTALLPHDTKVASQYVQRMVDILNSAGAKNVPVSFTLFMSTECFHDSSGSLSVEDLQLLDTRLGGQNSGYVSRVVVLQPGRHSYFGGEGLGAPKMSTETSLLVFLQNDSGKSRYRVSDQSVAQIVESMSPRSLRLPETAPLLIPIDSASDYKPSETSFSPSSFLDVHDPVSQVPQRVIRNDFGAIGGTAFSPVGDFHSRGGRRGRLFDLVDDGDEEHDNEDIMTGMLDNLDVGLFQNANIGADNVDIEAISLMGIGGPQHTSYHHFQNPGHPSTGRLG